MALVSLEERDHTEMEILTGLLPMSPFPWIQPHLSPLSEKSSGARAHGDTTDISQEPGRAEFASLKEVLGLEFSYPTRSLSFMP